MPDFLKKNADNSLQFGDILIEANDTIHDTKNNTVMADMAAKVATDRSNPDGGKGDFTATAKDGKQDLTVNGQYKAHTELDPSTGKSTYNQTDGNGKEEFSYNYQTGTLNGDGITFSEEGTHITGSDFAVNGSGSIETYSHWNAQNQQAGINDAQDNADLTGDNDSFNYVDVDVNVNSDYQSSGLPTDDGSDWSDGSTPDGSLTTDGSTGTDLAGDGPLSNLDSGFDSGNGDQPDAVADRSAPDNPPYPVGNRETASGGGDEQAWSSVGHSEPHLSCPMAGRIPRLKWAKSRLS